MVAFCVVPVTPVTSTWGPFSLLLYLVLVAPPFVCSGIVITAVLADAPARAGIVYSVDLLAAGAGAFLAPFALEWTGGYGALAIVAWLGLLGGLAFRPLDRRALGRLVIPAVLTALLLAYPGWAQRTLGADVQSEDGRWVRNLASRDFGGVQQTSWNPLGRVHVTGRGDSKEFGYRYGLSSSFLAQSIPGRLIFVDQVILLRQFLMTKDPRDVDFLGGFVWAAPYLLHPRPTRALIIGGGGGIDVLVAKHFKVPEIVTVEINSDTAKLLVGRPEDPDRADYAKWQLSDDRCQVRVEQAEGRHFCATQASGSYDFVVANATDTHSLVPGGNYNLSENFLYTVEAMTDYYRLLRPGGYVGISYWDLSSAPHALRVFSTLRAALEKQGVADPSRQMVALEGGGYFSAFVKNGVITPDEVQRLRTGPGRSASGCCSTRGSRRPSPRRRARRSSLCATASRRSRRSTMRRSRAISPSSPRDIRPTSDDRPFFYLIRRYDQGGLAGFLDGIVPIPELYSILIPLLLFNAVLTFLPFVLHRSRATPGAAGTSTGTLLRFNAFFGLCGFAFIFAELGAILILSVFVGGPFYALVVVLPSILVGYSLGSLVTVRFFRAGTGSWALLLVGAVLLGVGGELLPDLTRATMAASHEARIAVAVGVSTLLGVFLGCPVPWMMERVKKRSSELVPWMFAVNSGWNVIGGLLHVSVILIWGASSLFVAAALIYVAALLIVRRELTSCLPAT